MKKTLAILLVFSLTLCVQQDTHDVCVDVSNKNSSAGWFFRLREWGYDTKWGKGDCRFTVGRDYSFVDGAKKNIEGFEYRGKKYWIPLAVTTPCLIPGKAVVTNEGEKLVSESSGKYYSCIDIGKELFWDHLLFKPLVEEMLDSQPFVRKYPFENLNPVIVRMEIEPSDETIEQNWTITWQEVDRILEWDRYNTTYVVVGGFFEIYPWLADKMRGKNMMFHAYMNEYLTPLNGSEITRIVHEVDRINKELDLGVEGFGAPLNSGRFELIKALREHNFSFDSSLGVEKAGKDYFPQYPFGVGYDYETLEPEILEIPTTYPNDYDIFYVMKLNDSEALRVWISSFEKRYANNEIFVLHLHNWIIRERLDLVDEAVKQILKHPGTYVENYYVYERFNTCLKQDIDYRVENGRLFLEKLGDCNALINRQVKGADRVLIKNNKTFSIISEEGEYEIVDVVNTNVEIDVDYVSKRLRAYNPGVEEPQIVFKDGSELVEVEKKQGAYSLPLGKNQAAEYGLITG